MKILHIRGYDPLRDEPGDERTDARFPFTGIALADLEKALRVDHDCPDDERSYCDICTAIDDGFVLSAVRMLSGATDCPATDRVCYFHERKQTLPSYETCEAEWEEWVDWHSRIFPVQCLHCRSFNRSQAPSCYACRTDLPVSSEDSHQ